MATPAASGKELLYVVMPIYNEQASIGPVVREWKEMLTRVAPDHRILILNDGSKDNTAQVLAEIAAQTPGVEVINKPNSGHGRTCIHGYGEAITRGARWVFQIDSDGQFVVAEFPQLWARREEGDLVLGVRENRRDPTHRLLLSRVVRLASSLLVGARMRDVNTPFRLVRRAVWEDLRPLVGSSTLAPNIFVAVGAKVRGWNVVELPATHRPRVTGTGSLRALRLVRFSLRALGQLLAFRARLRRFPPRADT